jgi:hypothetical protein
MFVIVSWEIGVVRAGASVVLRAGSRHGGGRLTA